MRRRRFVRAPRRRSFWLGFFAQQDVTPSAPGGATQSSSAVVTWGTGQSPLEQDPRPTLVRIKGNLAIRAGRDTPISITLDTQEAFWSFGIMVQTGTTLQGEPPADPAKLGDERWIYTNHGIVTALVQGNPIWNGTSIQVLGTGTVSQISPYPQLYEVDVKAKRKFEDPTLLTTQFSVISPSGLENFASVGYRFMGRALFLAS